MRIGMSLPQLNVMLHEKLPLPPAKDDQACFYVTTKKQPKLFFMMLEGRLARIDVRIPGNNDHGNSGWRFGRARAASLRQ